MKKLLLFLIILIINAIVAYLVITGLYNYDGFDIKILIKGLAFSILITVPTMWAMTRKKNK